MKPRSIRVAEFVTGWGSCGQSGTIHIDWRLVFAPKRVLEYVVVHELGGDGPAACCDQPVAVLPLPVDAQLFAASVLALT